LIQATQMRAGMCILFEGDICRIMNVNHVTPGNWRGFVQAKMQMEYLYSDSAGHHFMNQETYDQITLDDETLGTNKLYLLPNTVLQIDFHDSQPVGIELPNTVTLEVVDTEPSMKGATASASYKPAKLETGLVVNVPPFVEVGNKIIVDTREDKYLSRA